MDKIDDSILKHSREYELSRIHETRENCFLPQLHTSPIPPYPKINYLYPKLKGIADG